MRVANSAYVRRLAAIVLFLLSVAFFIARAPYKVIRDPSRVGDFSSVYAAARCWIHGGNPYARPEFLAALADGGAPAPAVRDQDQHSSVYLIPAMPFIALLAWLPWQTAVVLWCLISVTCFIASLAILLKNLPLSLTGKFVAAGFCLFFHPTYIGLLTGNPSVFAVSLTMLALHFALGKRPRLSGILLGIALCIKPQIAICAILAFVLWKRWSPLFIGLALAALATIFATCWVSSFGQHWEWLASLQQNLVADASPGGLNDPRPSSPEASNLLNAQALSYLIAPNPALGQGLVLVSAAGIIAFYVYFAKRNGVTEPIIDQAFLAAVTLTVAYHRYYDGQLLLVLIPAAISLSRTGRLKSAAVPWMCLLLMSFPLGQFIDKAVGPVSAAGPSLAQVLPLRLYPIAIIATALVLSLHPLSRDRTAAIEESQR